MHRIAHFLARRRPDHTTAGGLGGLATVSLGSTFATTVSSASANMAPTPSSSSVTVVDTRDTALPMDAALPDLLRETFLLAATQPGTVAMMS